MNTKTLIFILLFASLTSYAKGPDLLIKNVTIVSAERQQPLNNAHVAINDGVISQISIQPINRTADKVIDGTGLFLTPGLMDSHVHLGTMPGVSTQPETATDMLRLQQVFRKNQPKAYLYYGVTQLLDLNMTSKRLAAFNHQAIRPDVSFCGAIGVLDGYGTAGRSFEQVVKITPYILLDKSLQNTFPADADPQKHTARYLVEQIAKDGASCIKIFLEDGFGRASHWTILSNKLVQQVRQEAKKYTLPVMAHANAIDMQKLAVENKVDGITHGMWNWNELDYQSGVPEDIEGIVNDVHRQKMIFQPTFNVMDGLVGVLTDEVFKDPYYRNVVPQEMINWYKTEGGRWFRREFVSSFGGLDPQQITTSFSRKISQNERVVKALADLNHPLVLASDTPSSPTYAAQPGYSTYQEILHMHKAGVSLKGIFDAATLNNAQAFGMTEDYGTVEAGKKASLLLMKKNPLEDISAYDSIQQVILRGKVIQRSELVANN